MRQRTERSELLSAKHCPESRIVLRILLTAEDGEVDNLKGVGELLDYLMIGLGDNDRVVHKCAATESAEDDDIRAIVSRSAHNGTGASRGGYRARQG